MVKKHRIEAAKSAFTTWLVMGCIFGAAAGYREKTPTDPSDIVAGLVLGLIIATVAALFRLAFPGKPPQSPQA